MFAVPGWSVSADSLKAETASKSTSQGAKSRKRKRAGGKPADTAVTQSNVADLYDEVLGGKLKKKKDGKQTADQPQNEKGAKKQKKSSEDGLKAGKERGEDRNADDHADGEKSKKDKKGSNHKSGEESKRSSDKSAKTQKAASDVTQTSSIPPPPPPPPTTKLTPLQASMREKLVSARFRHLNETLYTRPSEEAFQLFDESPEMFDEYHEGFRRQVKVWPENPVDSFLKDIRTRAALRQPGKGRFGGKPGARHPPPSAASDSSSSQLAKTSLPRTAGTCTIADLGCGDARLAESLQVDKAKLHLDVKSFDLQSPSPLVTKADIANLPLEDGSVNVAIFCLALMGTNWVDFVEEAYRILHWKGELWIAEIKSRFAPAASAGKNGVVTHSVGNRRKQAGKKGSAAQGQLAAANERFHERDLGIEVDGNEDRRRETDVSAFVEVLKKRGFVLQGESTDAVDLSNKMFVKMHFIKGASPTRGKGVAEARQAPQSKKQSIKWLDKLQEEEENDDQSSAKEAAILKPCVYKIR